MVVCRLNADNVQTYDPAENIHENGILAYSIVPARLNADICAQARQMAVRLAHELDYVGVLAVEMFVVGDAHELVVNEIAPRPHNSGHHTIDACAASQFQQQVRLMCGLPPADTKLFSPCCMANIFGRRVGRRRQRTELAAAAKRAPRPSAPVRQKSRAQRPQNGAFHRAGRRCRHRAG